VDAVVRPLLVVGTLLGTDKVKQDQHSATWLAHNKNMITLEMEISTGTLDFAHPVHSRGNRGDMSETQTVRTGITECSSLRVGMSWVGPCCCHTYTCYSPIVNR